MEASNKKNKKNTNTNSKTFNKKNLTKTAQIAPETSIKFLTNPLSTSNLKESTAESDNKISQQPKNKKLSIYLGSYEGNLYSVDLDLKTKELEMFKFKVSENSIKVITHQSQYIFASGIDEMIHIYDMNKKEEKGLFVTYAGSISNIFIVKDFLLASGDDCNIPIWRLSDFGLLHSLKGHKKSVVSLAVHKTGKFCISSAKDNTLIVWNLMNGLKIIKYNLKNLICNKIIFLNDEQHALIVFDNEFWIFNYLKNSELHQEWIEKKIKSDFKILDVISVADKLVLFSNLGEMAIYENALEAENDKVVLKVLDKPEKVDKEDLEIRIKALNYVKEKKLGLLNVIYSNNEVYVYDLNKILNLDNARKTYKTKKDNENTDEKEEDKEEVNANKVVVKKFKSINLKTGDRLTCLDGQILNN